MRQTTRGWRWGAPCVGARGAMEQLETRQVLATLLAGDANSDYYLDPADLIQALQSGKFETGLAASWAEGDWNGGPGGELGAPPPGNGVFDGADLVALFLTNQYAQGPYAPDAEAPLHTRTALVADGDADVSLGYDTATGRLSITATGLNLSTLHLHSAAGFIDSVKSAGVAQPTFGLNTEHDLFHIDTTNVGTLAAVNSQGWYLQPNLTQSQLLADLSIDGSRSSGGALGTVRLLMDPDDGGASVSGRIYLDANANGTQDAEETLGLNGHTVQLVPLGAASPVSRFAQSTTFDANADGTLDVATEAGLYTLQSLLPGPDVLRFTGHSHPFTYPAANQ